MNEAKVLTCLSRLAPSVLPYDDWLRVGMVCYNEGLSLTDWDSWSRQDSRYEEGTCSTKWRSFGKSNHATVKIGTLIQLCQTHLADVDFLFDDDVTPGGALDWSSPIHAPKDTKSKPKTVVDEHYLDPNVTVPRCTWSQESMDDFSRYLDLMFEPDEYVGYVAESWERDGRVMPTKGNYYFTAADLKEKCGRYPDLSYVIGTTNPAVGAWIRINPLDGAGCSDDNVTAYRHALLESDEGDLDKQYQILKALEVPCTCIVHSGGKSLHALVKVDAPDYDTYRKRVDYLYSVAKREGLTVDQANRNPSRLSRLPGVSRKGNPQYILEERCGAATWEAWEEYIAEKLDDDLPDPIQLDYDEAKLPPLAQEVICGVLRRGRKMMFTGPSKAGKSVCLKQLTVAMANGTPWMSMDIKQGNVLYVDTENNPEDFAVQFNEIYRAAGGRPENYSRIWVWHLKGKNINLKRLAKKLIRRIKGKSIVLLILDPIYKCMASDENSAEAMAEFCALLDYIVAETGVSLVFAHHHSKGAQGAKRSQDRASGSGVLARDADAIMDLLPLEMDKARLAQLVNRMQCAAMVQYCEAEGLDISMVEVQDLVYQPELLGRLGRLYPNHMADLASVSGAASEQAHYAQAHAIDFTLRSFAPKAQLRAFFAYPGHFCDEWDILADAKAIGDETPWDKQRREKQEASGKKRDNIKAEIEAYLIKVVNDHGGEVLYHDHKDALMTTLTSMTGKTLTDRTVRDKIARIVAGMDGYEMVDSVVNSVMHKAIKRVG